MYTNTPVAYCGEKKPKKKIKVRIFYSQGHRFYGFIQNYSNEGMLFMYQEKNMYVLIYLDEHMT